MVSELRTRIRRVGGVVGCAALALGATGCNSAGEGALFGAGLGAGGGAIIGSIFGEAGAGAAIGAVSGALFGGVVGDQNQRKASYAQASSNQTVVYANPAPQPAPVYVSPPPPPVVVYSAPPPVVYYSRPPVIYSYYGPARHVCFAGCGCGPRYYRPAPRWRNWNCY